MEPKPCGFPRCPALADKDRDHCPVHRPERVVERAKQIVNNHFARVAPFTKVAPYSQGHITAADLRELHHSIIEDLERTV